MSKHPQPAKHSQAATSEEITLDVLNTALDKTKVSSEILKNDRTPNSDGYLVVKEDMIAVGRIEVQVKTLKKNSNSKSLKLDNLSYAKTTILPFILIGVDQLNKKVYWKEISRELANNLINKALEKQIKSITIRFDEENEIGNHPPYLIWKNLIQDRLKKINDYDKKIEELIIVKEKLKNAISETTENSQSPDFINLNLFLDQLNVLFTYQFKFVRSYFKIEFYKLGMITFGRYDKTHMAYSLFPIMLHDNIKPIRKYLDNDFDKFISENPSVVAFTNQNPIFDDPIKYAKSVFWKYLDLMFEMNLIWPNNTILKNEYIFNAYDKRFDPNQLEPKYLKLAPFKHQIEKALSYLPDYAIDIEQKSTSPNNHFKVLDYIQDFRIMGIETIYRNSPSKNSILRILRHFEFTGKFPRNTKLVLTKFWNVYNKVYMNVINEYFASVSEKFEIHSYDTLLVIPYSKAFGRSPSAHKVPYMLIFKLKTESQFKNKVIIEENQNQIKFGFGTLEYNGIRFDIISNDHISLFSLDQELSIRKVVLNEIRKEVKKIFVTNIQ